MQHRQEIQNIAQELMIITKGIVAIGKDIMPLRQ